MPSSTDQNEYCVCAAMFGFQLVGSRPGPFFDIMPKRCYMLQGFGRLFGRIALAFLAYQIADFIFFNFFERAHLGPSALLRENAGFADYIIISSLPPI